MYVIKASSDSIRSEVVAAAVSSGGIGGFCGRRGVAAIGNIEGASGAPPRGTAAATSDLIFLADIFTASRYPAS